MVKIVSWATPPPPFFEVVLNNSSPGFLKVLQSFSLDIPCFITHFYILKQGKQGEEAVWQITQELWRAETKFEIFGSNHEGGQERGTAVNFYIAAEALSWFVARCSAS